MWAGGAEAITIQGRRIISTTGIKCEGNSVMLGGAVYPQPYVISAFIRIKNPFLMYGIDSQVLSTKQVNDLISNGYDGVLGMEDDGSVGEYVVFDPSQIAQFHEGVIEIPRNPLVRQRTIVMEDSCPAP